ncbi:MULTISPECIES: tRNA (adenosine(37)-N6)-threonylcarbamoyltransferase complex transferase subunit TsaD [unclassified Parvimonas]|uniref:tRNA (adenosine(37)-N6)-threonylcarbamoyltransferase complex transferase subunit TsaD n=1 Tax=unclassified Parvimonas TaxID=1151464 RepID=UPI002B46B2D2|nr:MULTISPECIES: tRNA (adenosine(37)-N6)-threonylcarbamoyltransferase complex transferase subunit TsaD [unclassified Parvimonas]MEB3025683.1 tRNA (adenosine(37)-N6)-threonylcarbamoyltransferase complex transferase subunit TsaD [Parvimonas sp. M13]MEB3089798.1 tRNA (adenosine(37)-N6)-threonylcarbamoyltransferase complex transferase subunit TsaD [Parvimonas sp. M20]
MDDIKIMAIESSCDETSVAVVKNGREIISNVISSQIDMHKKFGGVVPEVASRMHLEVINNIVREALEEAKITLDDIDAIAVTKGPGLVGALLVGISEAKALSYACKKPLVGVNHMKGHICAALITHKELEPPFICLLVSGGHTYLVHVKDYNNMEVIGKTIDDACGEAYDKVARCLGMNYPGGPEVERLAKFGNDEAIDFPRVMLDKNSYNFSFSGLKTAVLNYLNSKKQKNEEISKEDVCASFQRAVFDVLIYKTEKLMKEKNLDTLVVSGGVSANNTLREEINKMSESNNFKSYFPDKVLCTDNAAMIASSGYYEYIFGVRSDLTLNVEPNLEL